MAKIFKSDQFGDLQVPDNFAELPKTEQQKILKEAAQKKGSVESLQPEMSTGRYLEGLGDQALQGLTLGTSDEIGAAFAEMRPKNVLKSLFTDQKFGDAFNKRLSAQRARNKQFEAAYPKAALAANVGGSVAPIAASLLLAPFTGGSSTAATTASTVARAKNILDSSRLLSGGITKPGSSIGARTIEGLKTGSAQGFVGGIGYNESNTDTIGGVIYDKATGAVIGTVAGGLFGSALPTTISVGSIPFKATGRQIGKVFDKNKFTVEEKMAVKKISDLFLQDDITPDQVIQGIKQNISADKLEGVTPVEILADFGGEAAIRKLRGLNIIAPGDTIKKTLRERGSGSVEGIGQDIIDDVTSNIQSTRIGQSLQRASEDTINTKGINLSGGIEDIEQATRRELNPLYTEAFAKNQFVDNLELYKFLEVPIIKDAYEPARRNYLLEVQKMNPGQRILMEDTGIPPLKDLLVKGEKAQITGVTKNLPLAFLDQIKRSADQKTFGLKTTTGSNKIDSRTASNRKDVANQYRDLLKDSVKGDEYSTALKKGADKFSLEDAFNQGNKLQARTTKAETFKKYFNGLKTDAEKDAFRVGVFQYLSDQINTLGNNTNLANKLLSSPNVSTKLTVLFQGNDKAKKSFIDRLIREDRIAGTNQAILGQSATAEKAFDASQGLSSISDLMIALNEPTSSAGVRGGASVIGNLRAALFDPEGKKIQAMQNILLESNPNKQISILELIKQLNKIEKVGSGTESAIRKSISRSVVPQSSSVIRENLQ